MTDLTHQGAPEKGPSHGPKPLQTADWLEEENAELENAANCLASPPDGEVMGFACMEPSTLQWPPDKDVPQNPAEKAASHERERERGEGKETDGERASVQSECVSFKGRASMTESERELRMREKIKSAEGWQEKERESDMELKAHQKGSHLEIVMDEVNSMPDEAARVFGPGMIHTSGLSGSQDWGANEKSPFLGSHGAPINGYYQDWEPENPNKGCECCSRDVLKVGASLFSGAIIFPFLVWGGYVFLPFDAPLLETAPLRLIYTLRCSVFGVVPIVLGLLVYGISRWRYGALRPQYEGQAELKDVSVHRRFVDESVTLFILYFIQLSVLAAYLNHDLLKLVPLLTIVFTFGRLCYWVAAACGSSVRAFGFALSFLPMMTMLVANMYFIFVLDAEGSLFAKEAHATQDSPPSTYRQRFWG